MADYGSDFEALARQYWNSWGETMRGASAPSQPAMPGWNEAVAWWSQLAQGRGEEANAAVGRFDTQARGWFGKIQQLAARFAGSNASSADIVQAWKQMLGGDGANPFAEVFRSMGGRGQHGVEDWLGQVAPYLEAMQRDGRGWLGQPAFGFAREHQERLQRLAQACLEYQQHSQAYHALMAEAGQNAFVRFEDKLTERSEPGRQLGSARALFDLWIDAAEEAYAEIALSPRFRDAYGAFVNSQMRLRAGLQQEVEHTSALFGMPTRTEVDAAHRKIVQLERELRRLKDVVQGQGVSEPAAAKPGAAKPGATRPVSGRSGAKKAPAKKASVESVATGASAVKKTVSKPTATKPVAKPTAARGRAAKSIKGKR